MLFRFFDIYPCKNRVASAKMRSIWNTVINTEIHPFYALTEVSISRTSIHQSTSTTKSATTQLGLIVHRQSIFTDFWWHIFLFQLRVLSAY